MSLSARLRAATGELHARVEALPLAQSLAAGTVARDEYIQLLRCLLTAHAAWEAEVARQPACAAVWDADRARAAVIERDLVALGAEPEAADHPATDDWLAAVGGHPEPAAWLGVIYLFEGSRMGSMALLRPVARALGVPPAPGCGVDYHLDGAAGLMPRWQRFKAALDALPLTPGQQDAAAWAAVATFEMLHDLYAAPAGLAAAV